MEPDLRGPMTCPESRSGGAGSCRSRWFFVEIKDLVSLLRVLKISQVASAD